MLSNSKEVQYFLPAKADGLPMPARYFVRPEMLGQKAKAALKANGINYSKGGSVIALDREFVDRSIEGTKTEDREGYLWLLAERIFGHELAEKTPHSEGLERGLINTCPGSYLVVFRGIYI